MTSVGPARATEGPIAMTHRPRAILLEGRRGPPAPKAIARRARPFRAAACLCVGLWMAPALAGEPPLTPRYDLVRDGVATGATSALTLSLMALQKQLSPRECRWCDPPGLDARLSRGLRWHDTELADKGSTGLTLALGAAALGYGVLDGYQRGAPEVGWANALLVGEATSVAMLLDTSVKYAVGRRRPYASRGETRPGDRYDRNLSFFSMHTTLAFAAASSSSTLLLEQDAPHARAYALVTFGAATTVAYLRVAADRHYTSDVLVGAAVGSLVGWAIPHFLHAPEKSGVRLVPAPSGVALVW